MLEARFGLSAAGVNRTATATTYPVPGVVNVTQVQLGLFGSACLLRYRRNFAVTVDTDGATTLCDGFFPCSARSPA